MIYIIHWFHRIAIQKPGFKAYLTMSVTAIFYFLPLPQQQNFQTTMYCKIRKFP